jgi:hypothetical protein
MLELRPHTYVWGSVRVPANGEGRPERRSSPRFGDDAEALIASIERWLLEVRANKSPESIRLVAELEQILDEIRATLRGRKPD